MRAHGLACQPAMEIASNEVIKRAVELGAGIGLMSRAVVRREIDAGHLRALVLAEARRLSRPLYIAYHRRRQDSPLIQAVVAVAARLAKHRGERRPRR